MKKPNEIEVSPLFDEISNKTPKEDELFVSKSLHIASQIIAIIKKRNMLQKDFAEKMGKSEAEISKWLSGFHNFTIKTITKIEAELDETVITTPKKVLDDVFGLIDKFVSNINKNVKVKPFPAFTQELQTKIFVKSENQNCKVIYMESVINEKSSDFTEIQTG